MRQLRSTVGKFGGRRRDMEARQRSAARGAGRPAPPGGRRLPDSVARLTDELMELRVRLCRDLPRGAGGAGPVSSIRCSGPASWSSGSGCSSGAGVPRATRRSWNGGPHRSRFRGVSPSRLRDAPPARDDARPPARWPGRRRRPRLPPSTASPSPAWSRTASLPTSRGACARPPPRAPPPSISTSTLRAAASTPPSGSRTRCGASTVPVYAFVNPRAYSAGALIALSAKAIYMRPGAVLGAATPVDGAGREGLGEDGLRHARRVPRAGRGARARSAGRRGDGGRAGRGPGLDSPGQLLTLSTNEALRVGYAKASRGRRGRAARARSACRARGSSRVEPNWAELVVRFLTNPLVSPLLLSLGVLGLVFEIKTGAFGLGGLVSLASLGLFFGSSFLRRASRDGRRSSCWRRPGGALDRGVRAAGVRRRRRPGPGGARRGRHAGDDRHVADDRAT